MQSLAWLVFSAIASATEIELDPYAYQFDGLNFGPWPENSLPELEDRASLGLAFSGGGTRAQVASMGQLRGLMDLGILKDVKYITGISGGSWASASFVYAKTPMAEYLGNLEAPENITMTSLEKSTEGAGRYFAVKHNLILVIAEKLLLGYNIGEVWYRAISQVFLEPAGITWGSFFSWSDREVSDIKERNPALANDDWATVREGAPYLISTSTLTGPECAHFISQKKNKSQTLLESTPLYVGAAHTRHETYYGWPTEHHQIGGYVEPFAFGAMTNDSAHLPAGTHTGRLSGVMTNHASCGSAITPKSGQCSWPWALGHAVGASSWAPGLVLSGIPVLQGLDLDLPYWSPATPLSKVDNIGDEGPCGRFILADGGCTSNVYVSGLIKRGVKTVIAFVNSDICLSPSSAWTPQNSSAKETQKNVDDAFTSFFGIAPFDPGVYYGHNQIFPLADFVPTVQALQASQAAGKGAVATTDHITISNSDLGIKAGLKVKMVWVYLSRAYKFEEAISDPKVREAAFVNSGSKWDPRDVPKRGPFLNFPQWSTGSQLHISNEQANLMSHMQAWIMKENGDAIKDAVAHARKDAEAPLIV